MEQAIQYTELMLESYQVKGLRAYNIRRMAGNLLRKLKDKQSFPASALPDDIRRL